MIKKSSHLKNELLQAFLDQALEADDLQKTQIHLETCPACQEELKCLERLTIRLENLPEISLGKDFSGTVLNQLQENKKISRNLGWTLVIEAMVAAVVLGLLIPSFQAATWVPRILNTQLEIKVSINIFLAQLASNWLVWWAGLRLDITQIFRSLITPGQLSFGVFSPWILILAAGSLALLANYILLRRTFHQNRNH